MVNFLAGAKEEAYNADLEVIQLAVDAWFSDPSNVRFLGKNQYPLLGRGETSQVNRTVRKESFHHPDNGDPFDPKDEDPKEHRHHHHHDHDDDHHDHDDGDEHHTPHHPDWNPLGGIQGADLTTSNSGAPAWTDNKTGTKDGVREIKKDSPDKWTTVKVTREGVEYHVDARYYFIDTAALVRHGFLKETPKSSSKDNSITNTAAGSYTYYLNSLGRVETLPFAFPRTKDFIEGVYP
jgi:hypothetical protein